MVLSMLALQTNQIINLIIAFFMQHRHQQILMQLKYYPFNLCQSNPLFLIYGNIHRNITYYNIVMEQDKENNMLVFKKARTPIKKRTLQKPILPRRQSKDLKDKSLPDLNNERNRIAEYFKTYQPFGKQTLQEDIMKLKEKNNQLINENIRLKTAMTNLERDNVKLQKLISENKSPMASKVFGECNVMSLKQLLRECRKELMEQKNQNINIKKSLKYTKMGELELENKCLKQETVRLRNFLGADHVIELTSQKDVQEQTVAKRFNLTLNRKLKSSQDKPRTSKTQKDHQQAIQNLKKTIKQKEEIIDSMKIDGLKFIPKEKSSCKECEKLKEQITLNNLKIKQLEEKTKCVINNNSSTVIINNPPIASMHSQQVPPQHSKSQSSSKQQQPQSQPKQCESGFKMIRPSAQFYELLRQFLVYRFQAHHLSLDQLKLYIEQQVDSIVSVDVFAQLCLVEPFCIGNRDYLGALIGYLFYDDTSSSQITIKDTDSKPTQYIISKLHHFLGVYEILDIKREEQMYMQIAELITNYERHIESALVNRRNGDGTIPKKILQSFLIQIELDKEYIDFIISQIILDSIDMEHLNYNSMFEIFIISTNIMTPSLGTKLMSNSQLGASQMSKSAYSVMPVKELDEEYQQSQQSHHFKDDTEGEKQETEMNKNDVVDDNAKQDRGHDSVFHDECQQIEEYEPIHEQVDQPLTNDIQ